MRFIFSKNRFCKKLARILTSPPYDLDQADLVPNIPNLLETKAENEPKLREFLIQTLFQDATISTTLNWQKSWNNRYNGGYNCPLQPNLATFESISQAQNTAYSWSHKYRSVYFLTENENLAKSSVISLATGFRGVSGFYIKSDQEKMVFPGNLEVDIEANLTPSQVFQKTLEVIPEARLRQPMFDRNFLVKPATPVAQTPVQKKEDQPTQSSEETTASSQQATPKPVAKEPRPSPDNSLTGFSDQVSEPRQEKQIASESNPDSSQNLIQFGLLTLAVLAL